MLEVLKKNKKWIYVAILVLAAALSIEVFSSTIKANKVLSYVYSIQNHHDRASDEIHCIKLTNEVVLVQEFQSDSSFDGFSLCFHSENEKLEGNMYITVSEVETGKVVYEDEAENNSLSMDRLVNYYMDLDTRGEPGVRYLVKITTDTEDPDSAISVYLQNTGFYDGKMKIDGAYVADKNLSIGTFKYTSRPEHLYRKILMMTIFVFAIMCVVIIGFHCKLEVVTFIALLGFGGIYMLLFPPGKTCDPGYHFDVIYQYSNDILHIKEDDNSNKVYMRYDDYVMYKNCFKVYDGYYSNPTADAYLDEFDMFSIKVSDTTMVDSGDVQVADNVVPYLPYVIGVTIGRVLRLGALPTVYLARVFALITFALMVYWAIKIMPIGKEIMVVIALLPMTLQQFVSLSYDGMSIAVAMVFIAYWLAYMYSERDMNHNKNLVIMIILSILIGACKSGTYMFIGLLLITIPNKRMLKKTKILLIVTIIISAIVFNVTKYVGISNEATGLVVQAADANQYSAGGTYKLSYAVEHPIKFLGMSIGSLVENINYYCCFFFIFHTYAQNH